MKDFFLISLYLPCDYCHKVEPYKDDITVWGLPGIPSVVWVGSEKATPWRRSHCHFGCHDSGLGEDVTRIYRLAKKSVKWSNFSLRKAHD